MPISKSVLTVRPDYYPHWDITPTIREFQSYEELETFVLDIASPMAISNLTVYFHQLWYFNIGHMLFDGLYPAYLALIRFPPRHLQQFRLLVGLSAYGDKWAIDVCNRFSGLGIIRLDVLNKISSNKWFIFESLVMGSGNMCQRCTQPSAQLPGGIDMDGSRLFRNRMYITHELLPPVIRTKRQGPLIAYVIDNKRFTPQDRKEIHDAINDINRDTNLRLNERISYAKIIDRPLINVTFLNYSHVVPHIKTSKDYHSPFFINASMETKFQAQLRILRSMNIQITGPGTGQMYQTFLPDGAVNINLGGIESYNQSKGIIHYTTFMEQYMTSGTPYIKGLYYPINKRVKGLRKNEIKKLIQQAAHFISKGFTIPVDPTDNLAPDGKLFKEMCEKDRDFCTLVTVRVVERTFPCLDLWFERFIHETAQWSTEGLVYEGKNISCQFNRTLLRALREKYRIDHHII